ncbi:hypothetical protein ABPG74_007952 [Tetrahymena malaccensis]
MNTKLLIAIPILALLSISAICFIGNKKAHVIVAEDIPVADVITEDNTTNTTVNSIFPYLDVSFNVWNDCTSNVKQTCKSDKQCLLTFEEFLKLTYFPNTDQLISCRRFHQYVLKSFQLDQYHLSINKNGYYKDCYLNQEVIKTAQTSDFFYNEIFKPEYITCAGFFVSELSY